MCLSSSSMGSALVDLLERVCVGLFFTCPAPYPLLLLLIIHPCLQLGQACGPKAEKGVSTDTLMLCRACGYEVANGSDIHFMPSHLALSSRNDTLLGGRRIGVQLFENPHGTQFEVITFRRADVLLHWPADDRFSFFPGFAWTIATCPRCKAHLGWGFQPSQWPSRVSRPSLKSPKARFWV